jgi:hypothetical protein
LGQLLRNQICWKWHIAILGTTKNWCWMIRFRLCGGSVLGETHYNVYDIDRLEFFLQDSGRLLICPNWIDNNSGAVLAVVWGLVIYISHLGPKEPHFGGKSTCQNVCREKSPLIWTWPMSRTLVLFTIWYVWYSFKSNTLYFMSRY